MVSLPEQLDELLAMARESVATKKLDGARARLLGRCAAVEAIEYLQTDEGAKS